MTLITQIPDKIIFDDRNIVAVRKHKQLPAARAGQAGAGRVVEIGDGVNESGMVLLEQLLQSVHLHTLVIHGNTNHLEAKSAEQIQGACIGRAFHEDHISRVQQKLGDQGQGLLGAGRDENIVRVRVQSLACEDMGNALPQRTVSVPFAVIQGIAPVAAHDSLDRFANIVRREQIGIPDAARKADQLCRTPSIILEKRCFPR